MRQPRKPPKRPHIPLRSLSTPDGWHTTVRLEPEFWEALREIANSQKRSISAIAQEVRGGPHGLASAMRVYALTFYRFPPASDE